MKKAEQKGSDLKHSYMFWLPLIAVLREGIETVIFLAGTSSQYEVRTIAMYDTTVVTVVCLLSSFILYTRLRYQHRVIPTSIAPVCIYLFCLPS